MFTRPPALSDLLLIAFRRCPRDLLLSCALALAVLRKKNTAQEEVYKVSGQNIIQLIDLTPNTKTINILSLSYLKLAQGQEHKAQDVVKLAKDLILRLSIQSSPETIV